MQENNCKILLAHRYYWIIFDDKKYKSQQKVRFLQVCFIRDCIKNFTFVSLKFKK